MLEDAVRERGRRKRLDRTDRVSRDDQDLAGLDVPLVGRADEIHGARLGADDDGVAKAAKGEWPEAMGVADGHEAVAHQHDQRKRPLDLRHRLDDRVVDVAGLRSRVEVQDDLGVAVRLKD